MRVLFVAPSHALFHYGGVGHSCERITKGLLANGFEPIIALFDNSGDHRSNANVPTTFSQVTADGIPIFFSPRSDSVTGTPLESPTSTASRLQQAYLRLTQIIYAVKPDLLVAFYAYPFGYTASLLSRQLGIPLVLAFRGNDMERYAHNPRSLPLLQHSMETASGTIFVSQGMLALARSVHSGLRCPAVIFNGIAPQLLLRRWREVSSVSPIFGSVGFFKRKKGIDIFIRAVSELHSLRDRSILVGTMCDGHLSDDTCPIPITGALDHGETLDALNALDVFVAPSFSDGCPNAVLEAMAAGRTILTTRVGAMQDLLTHGRSAYFLDTWQVDEMKRALLELDGNHELRRQLSSGCRAVADSLTVDREASEWMRHLRMISLSARPQIPIDA